MPNPVGRPRKVYADSAEHDRGQYQGGRSGPEWKAVVAALKATPDAYICWVCGGDIQRDLPHNDRMAWTADHVQSLQNGGDPLSIHNLKPAHRSCNSKRGNLMVGQKSSRVW